MNPLRTRDTENIQYIFGYLDKKRGKWLVVPHRFNLILDNNGGVVGQFITSLWFSHVYEPNTVQRYILLGVRGGINYTNISSLITEIGIEEIASLRFALRGVLNIVYHEYFEISGSKTQETFNTVAGTGESVVINVQGSQNDVILSLCARHYQGGLYVTLPSFARQRAT
ncbi:MAG: hypothetical protein V3W20_01220 [Candidatus Neomarinimicrobiota bacterium]